MRAIVTGGAGLIGVYLVEPLPRPAAVNATTNRLLLVLHRARKTAGALAFSEAGWRREGLEAQAVPAATAAAAIAANCVRPIGRSVA
jgi:hypothetical protein